METDVIRQRVRAAMLGVESEAPRRLGRYDVLSVVGRGGMGVVYRARDAELDRIVALKVLRDDRVRDNDRLLLEARALAKLSHPNVLTVFEVGVEDEMMFLALEYVDGPDLRRWVQESSPQLEQRIELLVQVADGLAAAHAEGFVHCDVKPSNILVGPDGRARVADFGLARGLEGPTTQSEDEASSGQSGSKTGLSRAGTLGFMSPEQMRGYAATAKSDQFSFFATLVAVVTERLPFGSDRASEVSARMEQGEPQGLDALPAGLVAAVRRGLSLEPGERFASMAAVADALRSIQNRPKRRRLIMMLFGAALVPSAFAAWQAVNTTVERCADAERRLLNVWDDGRRAEVKEAILGTGVSYAPGAWERVETQLDDYAEAWASKHTEVCEASTEDSQGEDDRRLRLDCMHERFRSLRAVVDVLSRADAKTMERAVELTLGLPGFDRCDDIDALRAVVPPPEDAETRRVVESLREALADIDVALEASGAASLEEVERVVQQAEALGYGPLLAEAKIVQGQLHRAKGRYAQAEAALVQAHELAMEHRHDVVALRATQILTAVVGDHLARYAEGVVWGRAAVGHAKRSGDPRALAVSLGHIGGVFRVQGEYEQAQEHHERAVGIWEEIGETDSPDYAVSLGLLSATLASRRDYERAQRLQERGLKIWEQTLGAGHPKVATAQDNLGVMMANQGQYEEAKLRHERGLEVREAALGPVHPHVARSLNNLGRVLRMMGKLDESKLRHERAAQIHEQANGSEHPSAALNLENLGVSLALQGEYAQAKTVLERALRIRERVQGPEHPQLSHTLAQMGRLAAAQADYAQARAHYERALEIQQAAYGSESPDAAESLHSLGNLFLQTGEYARAKTHYDRALSIFEDKLGPDHPSTLTNVNNLGIVAQEQGNYAEARRHWTRVLESWELSLGAEHPSVAYPLVGLAEVALVEGDEKTARSYAERAVSIREKNQVAPKSLALARFVLARALWSDPDQRTRARSIAQQARAGFVQAGKAKEQDVADVDHWLEEHPAP